MAQALATSVQLGPNGERTLALAQRIGKIPWFKPDSLCADEHVEALVRGLCTQLEVPDCSVRRLGPEDVTDVVRDYNLATSPLWAELKQVPDRIQTAVRRTGRTDLLPYALNDLVELVFHSAFGGAFSRFGAKENTAVNFAVGAAMYTCGLAVAWELVADVDGMEKNPLLPLLALFEQGFLPLGVFQGQFCLA